MAQWHRHEDITGKSQMRQTNTNLPDRCQAALGLCFPNSDRVMKCGIGKPGSCTKSTMNCVCMSLSMRRTPNREQRDSQHQPPHLPEAGRGQGIATGRDLTHLAANGDKTVCQAALCLPVGQCELNLIELAWSTVKAYIAWHTTKYTLQDILRLTPEGFNHTTAHMWRKFCRHVVTVEEEYMVKDGIVEDIVEETTLTITPAIKTVRMKTW